MKIYYVTVLVLFSILFSIGCFAVHQDRKSLPKSLRGTFKKIEAHYVSEAGKNAVFLANCPKAKIRTSILSRTPKKFAIQDSDYSQEVMMRESVYVFDKQITTIGVDACGNRIIYRVSCESREAYGAPVFQRKDISPCRVIAESSSDEILKKKPEVQKESEGQSKTTPGPESKSTVGVVKEEAVESDNAKPEEDK